VQWKFWKRRKSAGGTVDHVGAKLPGPRDLPQQVGGYLVVRGKLDPDWVWTLKCVVRRYPERRAQYDFRVFNPEQAKQAGIKVINFMSLDHHPELILYQGKYNKYLQYAEFDKVPTEEKAA
jgi:hypothetical protein